MPSPGNSEITVPLLGVKEKYTVNEINLMGRGDILILYTDGLSDHRDAQRPANISPAASKSGSGRASSFRPGTYSSASRTTCWPSTTSPTTTSPFVIIKKI